MIRKLLAEDSQFIHLRKFGYYTSGGSKSPDLNNDALWLYPASARPTGSVPEPTFTTTSFNHP